MNPHALTIAETTIGIGDDDVLIISELARGLRCLDIGTGTGKAARAMMATAASVVSVDPEPLVTPPDPIETLRIRWEILRVPQYDFEFVFIDHFGNRLHCASEMVYHGIPLVALHDTNRVSSDISLIYDSFFSTHEIEHYETGFGITTLRARQPAKSLI